MTAVFAPVAVGILLGFPEIVSLARMAKARASLAFGEIPKLLMECIGIDGVRYWERNCIMVVL